jgi:hypothetical protein
MTPLAIQLTDRPTTDHCGLCGERTVARPGPRLCLADTWQSVCRRCARAHSPSLLALLELGHVAEQVGHIGRHTLVPPLNALLDLNRAAEKYLDTRNMACRHAA